MSIQKEGLRSISGHGEHQIFQFKDIGRERPQLKLVVWNPEYDPEPPVSMLSNIFYDVVRKIRGKKADVLERMFDI